MKNILCLCLCTVMFVSCTERMTKQFISQNNTASSEIISVGNWEIQPPKLVAFENKRIEEVTDSTYEYWLQIRVNSKKSANVETEFSIDSVGLEFIESDTIIWRYPTRVTPYNLSKKQKYLAFDFYRDAGIMIPDSVLNLYLKFDAVVSESSSKKSEKYPVLIVLNRNDVQGLIPFVTD